MPEEKMVRLTGEQLMNAYKNEQGKVDFLQRKQQSIQQILGEITAASESIKEITESAEDESMLVSLGAGIYAEAKLASKKSVKSSLAGSVLVNRSLKEAAEMLEGEKKKVEQELVRTTQEAQAAVQNMTNISAILDEAKRKAEEMKKGADPSKISSVS